MRVTPAMMRDAERARTLARYDKIINELMDALDKIRREIIIPVPVDAANRMLGMADYAINRCNAQRERNSDGYLVVKTEGVQ